MKAIKKILVATDFSEFSAEATKYAKICSKKFRAEINLTHVVDTVPVLGVSSLDLTFDKLARKTEKNANYSEHPLCPLYNSRMTL